MFNGLKCWGKDLSRRKLKIISDKFSNQSMDKKNDEEQHIYSKVYESVKVNEMTPPTRRSGYVVESDSFNLSTIVILSSLMLRCFDQII